MKLPDCMMPDGAEPCAGFLEAQEKVESMERRIRELEDALRARKIDVNSAALSAEKARADRLEAERDQWQESCGQNYVRATEAEMREERLKAENQRLREVLVAIDEWDIRWAEGLDSNVENIKDIVRKALEATDGQ